MAEGTKKRILETALELFAQNGYLGTSMNDVAGQLGFTKAALYKHYTSKQEILDKIVERMNKMDYERAESYEMPETEPDGFAEAYPNCFYRAFYGIEKLPEKRYRYLYCKSTVADTGGRRIHAYQTGIY